MFNGIVLIDKPVNWTSFDVVAKIRGIVSKSSQKKVKVGHSGTLDPFASGLLILLLGSYTKRALELTKLDKVYEVSSILGEISTTLDPEGDITSLSKRRPSELEIRKVLQKYIGEQMQSPPVFSALKINGQRAYHLARAGKTVQLESRPTTIYDNSLISYDYPTVKFISHVSSGTYIRSLVSDIGTDLGVGSYTKELRRLQIGNFDIKNAMSVTNCSAEDVLNALLPLSE